MITMRKQRGDFLLSLAIYGIAALVLTAGVWGWFAKHDKAVREAEAKLWEPQLEACKTNKQTALAANAQLEKDLKDLKDAHLAQDKGNNDDIDARTQAAERTRRLIDAAEAKARSREAENAKLRAQLAIKPAKDQTCEQKLAETDMILRGTAVDRILWSLSLPPLKPASGAANDRVRVN